MILRKNFLFILIIIFLSLNNYILAENSISQAKAFMQQLEIEINTYDRMLPERYSDNAIIIRYLEHPNGNLEKIILPTKNFKNYLKKIGFMAKITGYKNYYKDLNFKEEGKNMRIIGKRITHNGYSAPVSILLEKNSSGQYKIIEEITNTASKFLINQVLKN